MYSLTIRGFSKVPLYKRVPWVRTPFTTDLAPLDVLPQSLFTDYTNPATAGN